MGVPLHNEMAASLIAPCFNAVRDVYAEYLPLPEVPLHKLRKTQLLVDDRVRDSERHFAACREDGMQIIVAPEAADLPLGTLVAILSHEFGHAADFAYPAHWWLTTRAAPASFKIPERRAAAAMRAWEGRSTDQVELAADAIAQRVTGKRIGYCGPCMVQCFGGRPRPEGLR